MILDVKKFLAIIIEPENMLIIMLISSKIFSFTVK